MLFDAILHWCLQVAPALPAVLIPIAARKMHLITLQLHKLTYSKAYITFMQVREARTVSRGPRSALLATIRTIDQGSLPQKKRHKLP